MRFLAFQASPEQSNCTAICTHCPASHNGTPSTKTIITTIKPPLLCDLHPWIQPCNAGCIREKTCEDRTRRTNKVPYIAAGMHFVRENIEFGAIPTLSCITGRRNPTSLWWCGDVVMWWCEDVVMGWCIVVVMYCWRLLFFLPVVPHKAVAEVSKIGNLEEKLVVVNQGWQSEATDWPKGAWGLLSFSLLLWLSTYLPVYLLCIYLSIYLSIDLSIYLSISLSLCLSIDLSIYLSACCGILCNSVHFFISHLASWLRTRRFSEPTFRPSGAPNQWKNTMFLGMQ